MEVHENGKTDLVSLESGDDSGITISGPEEEEEDSRQNEDSADLKEVKTLDLNNSYPKTNYERVPSQNDGSKQGEGADSVEIRVQTQVSTSSGTDGDSHSALRDEELLRAATFVLDAKKGRNMDFKRGQKFVNAYLLYNKWYLVYTLYFVITVNLCLALFEKPAMQGWEAPYWATMIIELACLGFFIFRTAHAFYFTTKSRFWQDSKNIVVIVVILLTLIDMIGYIVWVNVGPAETAVRWSRVLRPMFIVNFPDGRQIRRSFRNIRRTLPEIANVLLLFFLSLLLFALLALKLFINKPELIYPNGRPYFKNYLDSMWDMYVLVTTANNPDVMMPAYDQSNWYALFFGVYLIICLYIFMSIVLAVIYNNYKKNLKNEVKLSVYNKRRKLAEAFNVLKVEHKGSFVVTGPRFVELMKAVDPKKSHTCVDLLLKVLDANGDLSIGKNEFLTLADLLQLPVSEVKDRMTIIETYFPQVYNHRASRFLQLVVRHRFFRFFFDLMIFINAFFIGFSVDQADWFFLFIFTVEITLKLYTFGVKEFFSRFWNVFDFFVIGIALIASIVEAAMGADQEEFQTLDPLLVLRVMRLIKIFGSIPRFKVIILTIVNIGPPILSFGGVIFIIYYIFAIIGMEIYHGRIEYFEDIYNASAMLPNSSRFCGNMLLKNSDFFRFRYCSNNFNNLPKAFVLLFELTVVNQWHVLSSGFVLVTHKAARLYFFVFHVTTVVIVLNIFVAFILEAFILEYSLSRAGRLESAVESKIKEMGLGIGVKTDRIFKAKDDKIELVDNEQEVAQSDVADAPHDDDSDNDSLPDITRETGMRFHLKKKSRKKMEVLLQHMFEGEIDPEDEGFEDTQESRPRRLTLDVVS